MPSTPFPSAKDCSGQVITLDTAGAFIEPSPSFFLRTYGGYSRMTGNPEVMLALGRCFDHFRIADNSELFVGAANLI